MKQFKFLCSVVIWYNLLSPVISVSKIMQKINFNIGTAMEFLEILLSYLKDQRLENDKSFDIMVLEATKLTSDIDLEHTFQYLIGRVTEFRVKRNFNYGNVILSTPKF